MQTVDTTREQWLKRSTDMILESILTPLVTGNAPPPPVRVSVAPMTSKVLGLCHPRQNSEDKHNEIFITAHMDDSTRILDVLTHELIHALDDCASGHRNFFAKTARRAGLEGKFTATTAGPELTQKLDNIVSVLGPIPHARLNLKPKSKGRNNNKIMCECGFQANLSAKWADVIQEESLCPVCHNGVLEVKRA